LAPRVAQVGGLVDGEYPSSSGTAACTYTQMAGYIPNSDVREHAKIDLDQSAMEAALKAGEFIQVR